jgi:RIO kinase 1
MSSERFLNKKWFKKLDIQDQAILDRIGLDRKTLDEVFDKSTLHSLEKLISDKVIDILDFPISTGKEGNVFRGVTSKNNFVAVKIYRTSTSIFKNISKYIIGDPRFNNITKNRRDIIYIWTQKEYKNLERLKKIGINSPKPLFKINNVLVMEYIGDNNPAPMMKDVDLKNPEKTLEILIDFIDRMYKKAKLVHSDLSEFNILIFKNKPFVIDLGQGVLIEHPNSMIFLNRDIQNILNHFKKYGIKKDKDEIIKHIIGK